MSIIILFVCAIAIANLVTLLTGVDFLEPVRLGLAGVPFLGKLSGCTLCQSLWLSGLCVFFLPVCPFGWVGAFWVVERLICWMFLHALSMVTIQAMAKFLS